MVTVYAVASPIVRGDVEPINAGRDAPSLLDLFIQTASKWNVRSGGN
jgi:hypothetical protein